MSSLGNKISAHAETKEGVKGVSLSPHSPSLIETSVVTGNDHHDIQGVTSEMNGSGDQTNGPSSDLTVPESPLYQLYVDAKTHFDDDDNSEEVGSDGASETDEKHADDSVDHASVTNLLVEDTNIQDAGDLTQNGEFVQPDDETAAVVCAQAEELFSDEGVLKESYLMKHIRRNKLGFVSLKVVNSLRKMKRLTRDHRVIAYSITKLSTTLELNENSTKVRRKIPVNLPPLIKSSPAEDADNDENVAAEFRTVVVVNIPQETPLTIEGVAELFRKSGPVTQIRLLRSGSGALEGLGKDILRNLDKHNVLDGGRSALIEFEHLPAAKQACKKMTNKTDWRHGMRVTLLALQPGAKKNGGGDEARDDEDWSGREGDQKGGSDRYDDSK